MRGVLNDSLTQILLECFQMAGEFYHSEIHDLRLFICCKIWILGETSFSTFYTLIKQIIANTTKICQ